MNTTQAQQKALDDALVAFVDRLEFEKGNMKLKTDIKPKEATFQKANSVKSPKKKPAQATKGTRLKSSAKVAISNKKKLHANMPKIKGLAVLSEVALPEAEQLKLATKRSKTQFHSSHTSGSGNGVNTQSKVPDEQQQKVSESWTFSQDEEDDDEETDVNDDSEETKFDNDGDDLTHPNLSTYKADDEEEEEEKLDDEEMSFDQRVSTPPNYELTNKEENKEGDDKDKEGEHVQDEEDDQYRDVNINLERSNAEMTDAQANQDTEDSYVTLTPVPLVAQQQSSSVSSDLMLKFINPSPDISRHNFIALTQVDQVMELTLSQRDNEESWTFSQDEEDDDEETNVNDDSEETKFDNDGDDLTHPNLYMIIAVTSLKIMKWFGYSHLEKIIVQRQDDQLYKFREGDFKRLRRQDIKDMLLLLVQDKLTNLNLEEQFSLKVAL
nr:hypothetical protein [Tanacetum cinerariifolium]